MTESQKQVEKNRRTQLRVALISFSAAVFGAFVGSFTTIYFSKNNEKETRIFEIKEKHYSTFLETYSKYFSQSTLVEEYKKERKEWFQKAIETHHREKREDLLNCYENIPWQCLTGTEEEMKSIKAAQKIAYDHTIVIQADKLDRETITPQLMIDSNLNTEIRTEILDNRRRISGDYSTYTGTTLQEEFYINGFYYFETHISDILRKNLEQHIE